MCRDNIFNIYFITALSYSGDLQGYTHLIYNSPHRLLLLISLLSYPLHDLLASSTLLQSISPTTAAHRNKRGEIGTEVEVKGIEMRSLT
jgi:hypothetical protein